MNRIKQLSILLLALGLAGCAAMEQESNEQNNAYLRAKSVPPPTKMPQGLKTTNAQNYYPVPPAQQGTATQRPSTMPPGNGSTAAPQQQSPAVAQAQQSAAQKVASAAPAVAASSTSSLVLNMNSSAAWGKVGNALQASGYKVMQQDRSMGSYYVLDLAGTGGVLKTNTPIYQVHIKPSGNNSTVTLLNDKNQSASPVVSSRILGAVKKRLQ